jgi:hypothetical protein
MKKILIALIALIGVVTLQFPAHEALAAPSIRIFKAATGEEGVSSFTVPKDAGQSSWPVYIALSEAPSSPVTLEVRHQGAAVFYWSGSNDLTFTRDDWNRRRRLVLEYQGTAQPGARGRIIISGNGLSTREILFTVEGTSENNGGSGNNNGSGTGGSGGGDPTKLAENITTDDLKGLGFSQLEISGLFDRLIQLLLILIALGAFFSIMYSGYQYITSGGDMAVTAKARKNITWAIIGILIALLAFAAVRYVAGIGERGSLVQIPDSANNNNSTSTTNENTATSGATADPNGVSILVFDPSNFSPSTVLLRDLTTQISEQFALQLSAPAGEVTVTITKTGKLPITVTPDSFTFNDQNWQQSQPFGISYAGDGQSGEAAEVIIKTSTGARYVIRVEAP